MKHIYVVFIAALVLLVKGCYPEPVANFSYTYDDNTAPALVSFTNHSTDADEYLWNFGDGGTSTSPSPTYTYEEGGTYSITLKASGRGGDNTMPKNITIKDPTSYIFRNNSSVTLYDVLTFYYDGSDIYDEISHGTVPSGYQTSEVITEHPSTDVAMRLPDGRIVWVVETFYLTPNHLTYVDFDDYTSFIVINSEVRDINSLGDLRQLSKNGKIMKLMDLEEQ